MAIAYSMGQVINSVCLCQCVCLSVCMSVRTLMLTDFTNSGTEATTPKGKNEFLESHRCTINFCPKTPILGVRIGGFKPNSQHIKTCIFRNYCMDSNQILHSDKGHQMPFVGGLNIRITNPRWRTAAILEKSKNCHISATV